MGLDLQNLAWLGEDGQVHHIQNQNGQHLLGATYQPTMQNLAVKTSTKCPAGSVKEFRTCSTWTETDKKGRKTVNEKCTDCDGY